MRIAGAEHPAAKALQVRMLHYAFHQELRQPASAVRLYDEHVGKIGERREVRNNAGKTNLVATFIRAKTQRVRDAAFHDLARYAFRPVGARQVAVDEVDIQARGIGGDEVVIAAMESMGHESSSERRVTNHTI